MAYRRKWGNRGGYRKRGFRRKRGLWLPTLGSTWGDETQAFYDSSNTWRIGNVEDDKSLAPVPEFFALVPDFTFLPSEGSANRAASLHDRASGNSWMLDRIVGTCHVHCKERDEGAGQWPYIQVCAGIFVSRSEEGADGAPDLFPDEFNPLARDNIQNPWVWRKTWMLGNPAGTAVLRDDFPISNSAYGSEWTDATVNVKAKRMIRREHRLFFAVAAQGWDGTAPSNIGTVAQPGAEGVLDIRLYGRLITNPRAGSSF